MQTKTEVIQKVITWVNETFTPYGLKPIEDLPKSLPADGSYCVLANVLKEIPDFSEVHVGAFEIDLRLPTYKKDMQDSKLANMFTWEDGNGYEYCSDDTIDVPTEVSDFIEAFDRGDFPEFIDIEQLKSVYDMGGGYRSEYLESLVETLEENGVDIWGPQKESDKPHVGLFPIEN